MGRSTSWRCRKTGGWELTQVRIMKIIMIIIIMLQLAPNAPKMVAIVIFTTKLFNIAFQFRKQCGSRFWNRVL